MTAYLNSGTMLTLNVINTEGRVCISAIDLCSELEKAFGTERANEVLDAIGNLMVAVSCPVISCRGTEPVHAIYIHDFTYCAQQLDLNYVLMCDGQEINADGSLSGINT